MIESLELSCQYCEATQDIYLTKRVEPSGDFQSFCDADHLDSYLRSQSVSKSNKKLKVVGLADNPDLMETSLEQISSATEAEFIFFLYQLRTLCCTDMVRQLMAKENLGAKYQELRSSQPNSLNDLFFLTDIFKFALGKEMPEQNQAFIVKRIQSIFKEAKTTSLNPSEDNINVDRAIYFMIVKNTIDTLVNLHIADPIQNTLVTHSSESTKGGQKIVRQAVAEPPGALQYLSLEDLELKKKTIIVREGYYAEHHVQLTSRMPDFRDISVRQLMDSLRNYVYCEPDFLLAEKITKVDLVGNESSRLRVLNAKETLNGLLNKDILILRNFRKLPTTPVSELITIDVCMPSAVFGQTLHFAFNILKADDLEALQDLITTELQRYYLPTDAQHSPYQVKMKNISARTKELKDAITSGEMKKKGVFQIELRLDDIKFKPENEEALYSKAELEFFSSNLNSIYSDKFLTEAASFFSLTPVELKKTIEKLDDQCSTHLKVGRILRSILVGDKLRDLECLHKHSFLFPPLCETSAKENCELVVNYNAVLSASRRYPVRGQLDLHTNYASVVCSALQNQIGDAPLPKLLCITANHVSALTFKTYLDGLLQSSLEFNSKVKYVLKAVLQTEYDPRGVAVGIFMKNVAEWSQWKANDLLKPNSRWHKSKQVIAVFELQTTWIFL